jgi:hypothetical protein
MAIDPLDQLRSEGMIWAASITSPHPRQLMILAHHTEGHPFIRAYIYLAYSGMIRM